MHVKRVEKYFCGININFKGIIKVLSTFECNWSLKLLCGKFIVVNFFAFSGVKTFSLKSCVCKKNTFASVASPGTHFIQSSSPSYYLIGLCRPHFAIWPSGHCTDLPWTVTVRFITLHYIILHYITLHYITLHYITLHYVTLQYY